MVRDPRKKIQGSSQNSTNPQTGSGQTKGKVKGRKNLSKVSQSLSDSRITVNKQTVTKLTGFGSIPEHPTVQYNIQESHAKPRITQSETLANNVTNNNFRTSRTNGPKISTNSIRLIQQYPHKFCSESNETNKDLKTKSVPLTEQSQSRTDGITLNVNIPSENKSIADISISSELFRIPAKVQAQGSKSEMLASEFKKPMSLMEQKKQQWAREKEELNGLWSPWGRPLSNTTHPINSQTYVNKLQTSSLQSECHLPPIMTNLSPPSRQQQQQRSLWNSEVDKEAVGLRVSRKSSLPICINATTGEVHYNHSQVGGIQQTDTFQVNNAVMISSNSNLHNALNISAVKYDSHSKAMEGKRTSSHFQQQSAHSVTSTTNGGWSSMDEEAFTSGYHSEVNGCLSNEEYSGVSRNGSGDGPRAGDLSKGKGGVAKGQSQNNKSQSNNENDSSQNVIVHNINLDRRSHHRGAEERKHHDSKNNNLHPNNNKVINPTPSAMRSSITVGLDSAITNTDSYKEIQKLEKEKWLAELEKQREEQRVRKQMEKDEKRPKWGDKGIGVGHFWEPSQSNDHLPQPSRDDSSIANPPAWLEKGLSRMQNSVSQPSLYNGSSQTSSEFQGASNLFSNQSTVDLRNVVGLGDLTQNDRSYLRGQNVPPDPDIAAEKERKRLAAIEHQEAIRKQIEERQQRLKEEKERRLQEELEDEEKARFQHLRELELIELEARKMRFYNNCQNSEEGEEPKYQYDLTETKNVRKILTPEVEESQSERKSRMEEESKEREARRSSVGSEVIPEPETSLPNDSIFPANYLTASQSMVNISRQGSFQEESLPPTPFRDNELTPDPERTTSSVRSRSLSNQREFGTQTDLESKRDSKDSQKHRSHNCLAKGSKSKGSTGEESESKKKAEKPRWGVAQNKKQYVKQSEKDPLYQQRLKRRMDRIKKIEDRLHGVNGIGIGTGGGDTGTESEELPSTRSRGRSPPSRFRNRHFNNNNATVHRAPSESNISPRKQVPMKATARIQMNHNKPLTAETPRENFNDNHSNSSSRAKKIFPDIPGRTIGPLNASGNPEFDPFGLKGQASSETSSRFSSPSIESMNSKNMETHYFKHHVGGMGDSVEVDLESRFISSTSRSVEIHYDPNNMESRVSPLGKKTIIESSSDEVMYRKTVFGNSNKTIQSEPDVPLLNKHSYQPEKYSSHATHSNNVRHKVPKTPAAPPPPTHSQKMSRYSDTTTSSSSRHYERTEEQGKKSRNKASPLKGIISPIIPNPISPAVPNPITIPTRMGSPPVPALLKKLQAGIPLEDIAVCDDFLYEIPRAQTGGSTSNGYKSVESDSSSHLPIRSRLSSSGGLEIDIDPNYELASIQLRSQSPHNTEDTEEKLDELERDDDEDEKDLYGDEKDPFGGEKDPFGNPKDPFGDEKEEKGDHEDEEYEDKDEEIDESKPFEPYEDEDEDEEDTGKDFDDQPLYPYPVEKIKPRLPSPTLQLKKPDSPVRPRVSSRTTTLEVMADYRKFNLPDYDYDSVKLFPHVDIGGMDVTAAVHNIRRPGTQDTDLSKREKLISYVINNKDVQAQISARDSELSEKGIIEFNVRLPANADDVYGDYVDYKDPLLSERQRATIRWLYSSDSSSNSKDSILTHLSYLKKGIQQQQQEWNVVPSDTEDTGCDEDDSLSHHYSGGSTNDNSSEDSKFSTQS